MPKTIEHQLARAAREMRVGDLAAADRRLRTVLEGAPRHAAALQLLGLVALRRGLTRQAAESLRAAADAAPGNPEIRAHLAEVLRQSGEAGAAAGEAREAVRLAPRAPAAHNNLGLALQAAGDLEGAEAAFRRACELDPRYAKGRYNLAGVLRRSGRLEDAERQLRQALRLVPRYPQAWNALGAVLARTGRADEAAAAYRRCLELAPGYAKAHFNLGALLAEEGREEALASFDRALAIDPAYVKAVAAKARLLGRLERQREAEETLRRALAVPPDQPDLWEALGGLLFARFDYAGAARAFARALELDPDRPEARGSLAFSRAEICDWRRRDDEIAAVERLIAERLRAGETSPLSPHAAAFFPLPPATQRAIAERQAERIAAEVGDRRLSPPKPPSPERPRRLRIGYLSSDFRDNALAHLTRRLYGLHDRDRFEVYGYSLGVDDGSEYRRGIAADCDRFVDLRASTDLEAARRIRDDGVHVLVDLVGFAGGSRSRIPAHRPAPVQAIWLYPGTMGGVFHDYFLGDPVITPGGGDAQIAEAIAVLPHSYQVNDHRQPIAESAPERPALGLPEEAFVFCCFCAPAKIEPEIFGTWMRILDRVPGSLLWLLDLGAEARGNLRREAETRGVSPDRLVFGRHVPKPDHLARLQRADLALDTMVCNGHTTVSDALWAGLPVITTPGRHLAGRVAASLLEAVGLSSLVVWDPARYEELAVRLATHPEELVGLRQELAANRETRPLFDTPRFVANLERAYDAMWSRYARGDRPATLIVEETAR